MRRPQHRLSWIILAGLTTCIKIQALIATARLRRHVGVGDKARPFVVARLPSRSNGDDLEDINDQDLIGPEESRMKGFIANYLRRKDERVDNEGDDEDAMIDRYTNDLETYTHLVGIPMDNCHQLMLELESVQRAILYHCPILVHACIQQAITRLPLLYVKTNGPTASSRLFSIVEEVIENHILQRIEEEDEIDEEDIVNEDGKRPFMLRFSSLEIDGPRNEVLQAVVSPKDSNKLRTIVEDLQARIHRETDWKTLLPPDPRSNHFRARVPFMRLPETWDDLLERPEGTPKDDFVFLPSDKGGNGISPIFWGKWEADDFGTARMREVAIFRRSLQSTGLDEKAFYLPEKHVDLPKGNLAMSKQESHYAEYQERRFLEAEALEMGILKQNSEIPEDDALLQMTKERLEALYAQDETVIPDDNKVQHDDDDDDDDEDEGNIVDDERVVRPGDPAILDDWTKDRIKKIVASRAKLQSEKELAKPKMKPPIAENEIFRKYKEGTLAPKSETPISTRELPPFPSPQHCVGFWRVLESPTGFDVEETDNSRTDNLVLRVDGTTAGGPILDQTTRQKAAGGTWRLEGDIIQIRLVIPPGKDRILVMQGKLQCVSARSDIRLAPSSFGIPELEARKAQSTTEFEDVVYCKGEVWLEDAVTKTNRYNFGRFSLMKINTPTDPKQFTITIPQPIRNQD